MPSAPDSSSRINVLDRVSRPRAGPERLQRQRVLTSPSVLNLPAPMNRTSILHTMDESVDHALADFKANVSPWQNPVEWVAADSEHINSVVQQIAQLTRRVEIHQASFTDQLIVYPVNYGYLMDLAHSLIMQLLTASHSLYIFSSYALRGRQYVGLPILPPFYPLILSLDFLIN
jgi:hypothetical protein